MPHSDVPNQAGDEGARPPEKSEPEVPPVRGSTRVCRQPGWLSDYAPQVSLETEEDVGIASMLLPSGFPSDLEMGILSRAVRLSVLVDALMRVCA